MTVLLAMSGGVDSSVACYLLHQEGYDVKGVTFDIGVTDRNKFERDVSDAKKVASELGIEHEVVSYKELFKSEVLEKFVKGYEEGKTPNPCAICNRVLKFGALLDYAMDNGYEFLATGHYARLKEVGGKKYLFKAKDDKKDQTYFLYGVKDWSKVLFPLGDYTKEEIRKIASKLNLATKEKKDSQEVCFIKNDYRDFLKSYKKIDEKLGNYVDDKGNVLGSHCGISNYTIGQRKGLNISFGSRKYVVNIDKDKNEVILGDDEDLYHNTVEAFIHPDKLSTEIEDKIYEVKVRYTRKGESAKVAINDNRLIAYFTNAVRGPAPGQSMVVYDGDRLVIGGEIYKFYDK